MALEKSLQDGTYYKVNGTERVLYWNGSEWMKPVKIAGVRYGYVSPLEKQPRSIKSVEEIVNGHKIYG